MPPPANPSSACPPRRRAAIALAAQGFADPRARRRADRAGRCGGCSTASASSRSTRSTCSSARTTCRCSARVGPYDTRRCSTARAHYAPRRLFEYWGHEASLIPVALQPRAALADGARGRRRVGRDAADPARAARARRRGARRGARARARSPRARCSRQERPKRTGPWWDWSDVKRAIEWLFWSGQITSARRRGFERLYDLPERVLPAEVLAHADAAARGGAADAAARRRAVARRRDRADLRDYFRLPGGRRKARVAELVEAGELWPVDGRGLAQPGLPRPRRADAARASTPARSSARSTR